MKKNIIISVSIILILVLTYFTFSYREKYRDLWLSYVTLQIRTQSPSHEIPKSSVNKKIRFNYLDNSEIIDNPYPMLPYDLAVIGKLPKNEISKYTAARIAEAILYSKFGNKVIECRPIYVFSHKNKWIVSTEHAEKDIGSPYFEISKKDGRIIRYILSKE